MGVLVAPAAFAQTEPEVSTGCTALASDTIVSGATVSGDFFAGETITFTVDSDFDPATDTYTITVDGVAVATNYTQESYTHTFAADATGVDIQVTVTVGTFTVSVLCNNAAEEEPEDFTLCHFPPGNPAAAHTIRVGSQNAFDTHIEKHDDTPGACPPGVNSRADDVGAGLVFFIILDTDGDGDVTEVISIWGLCEEGECASIVDITIEQVVILIGQLDVNGYVEFDASDDDGYTIRIYYLGYQDREGDGTFAEVFQINVYLNGVLNNDDVLILIADDGGISWTLNPDLGVDISILFSDGDDDDEDECEAEDADDADDADDTDTEDDECEVEGDNT